jgi:hypothetical protein
LTTITAGAIGRAQVNAASKARPDFTTLTRHWKRARLYFLPISGLALISASAWQASTWCGLLTTGICAFTLDYMIGVGGKQ